MLVPVFAAALLAFPSPQGEVKAEASLSGSQFEPGAAATLRVTLEIKDGWHVYHPDQSPDVPGIRTSLKPGEGLTANGSLSVDQAGQPHVERIGSESLDYLWLSGKPTFSLPVKVPETAGTYEVPIDVRYQACTATNCLLPDTLAPTVTFTVGGPPGTELKQDAGGSTGGTGFGSNDFLQEFRKPNAGLTPEEKVTWSVSLSKSSGKSGDTAELILKAQVVDGWHVYHPDMNPRFGLPVVITQLDGGLVAVDDGPLRSSKAGVLHSEQIGPDLYEYIWLDGAVEFRKRVYFDGEPGDYTAAVTVRSQACDDRVCEGAVFTALVVPITIEAGGERVAVDFWLFLLTAVLAGFATLATPCVFPMIPITVSFFTKRAEKGHGTALGNATAYGLGILFTFVGLGLGLAAILGASGANDFATHPILNLALAALFLWLGFSLLGYYDIKPPKWLSSKASKAQGSQKGGYLPVLLMAVAFTVTAFTCTVGFVGAVLVLAAKSGEWLWALAGMTAYAAAFALPFFFLAAFPSWLQKLPTAGGWMNYVKASMGFLEIFFAFKFLSNADMSWDLQLLTRDVYIVLVTVPLVLWALYFLGAYKLPHDFGKPERTVSRSLVGVLILAFAGYVGYGFRNPTPYVGALEAYFPPPHYGSASLGGSLVEGPAGLTWYEDYHEAFEKAKELNKPLFIDFTGVTCVNCRRMEGNIFPDEQVRPFLEQYVRAELWVDKGEHADWNKQHEIERYNTAQQPLYVTLDPRTDTVLGKVDGYDPNPDRFATFLSDGLKAYYPEGSEGK